ncbi:hypothetical protein DID77_04625 [Candidatus Marinamargulisbacteria bacterium SCGC AG-439-L15]|nr:hypothetical protein DID77_04625 [Candidatus Marinamargulisbacteria bacterium SCGC AG-439-L15]
MLVYDTLFLADATPLLTSLTLLKTLALGLVFGLLGTIVTLFKIRHNWAPDRLQEVITLMLVVLVYTLANSIQTGPVLWVLLLWVFY